MYINNIQLITKSFINLNHSLTTLIKHNIMENTSNNPNQDTQPELNARAEEAKGPTLIIWFIFLCAIAFLTSLIYGQEHDSTHSRSKLFNLFNHSNYNKIENKIDKNNRIILLGDQEDGIGIFINQFVNERYVQGKYIKRRDYHPGSNLLYKTDTLLLKPYNYLKNHIFSDNDPILWVIETDNSLTLDDLEEIHQFAESRKNDSIIVVSEAVPQKAKKAYPKFKILEFDKLSTKDVEIYLLKEYNLNAINLKNLFTGFEDDLEKIDEFIHQSEDIEGSFVQTYAKQAYNLQNLLCDNTKKVEKLLKSICKNGFVRVQSPYSWIPIDNGVVHYSEVDKTYRWYNQKSIYAVSDKYDIVCKTDIELIPIKFQQVSQKKSKSQKNIQPKLKQKTQSKSGVKEKSKSKSTSTNKKKK